MQNPSIFSSDISVKIDFNSKVPLFHTNALTAVSGGQGVGFQGLRGSKGRLSESKGVKGLAYRVQGDQGVGQQGPRGLRGRVSGSQGSRGRPTRSQGVKG